jgi:GT2 family glycosyltransferase
MEIPLSVVVPAQRWSPHLARALHSVLAQSSGAPELVVVDNSVDGSLTADIRRRYGEGECRTVTCYRNTFFADGANVGIRATCRPFVALLNDDAWVAPGWAEEILVGFASAEVGSVASVVLQHANPHLIDSMGDHLSLTGHAGGIAWNEPASSIPVEPCEVFSVSAACAVYRRGAFEQAGGFDDSFVAYLEDVDLGFRLQLLGYRCVLVPSAVAHHLGGATYKPRHYALVLTERNMVWNLAKNLPSQLFRRYWTQILATQAQPAPILGGASRRAWLEGKSKAFAAWPSLRARRHAIQGSVCVDVRYLEKLMRSRDITVCHL